jgi:hypothetical protein
MKYKDNLIHHKLANELDTELIGTRKCKDFVNTIHRVYKDTYSCGQSTRSYLVERTNKGKTYFWFLEFEEALTCYLDHE